MNSNGSSVIASVDSLGYRGYVLRRTICYVCNRLNRITPFDATLHRVIRGHKLSFELRDYHGCFFYFRTLVEPENTALLRAIGEESGGGDFVDVGANYGQISSELLGKFSSMVLVEPNPRAASFLRSLFAGENAVHVVEAGAGEVRQSGVFCIADEDQSGGSHISTNGNEAGPEIAVTTVDDIVEETGVKPAVVKIDVEGFEERVLRGAVGTIKKHRPILAWEVRSRECFEACKKSVPNWDFYRADSDLVLGSTVVEKMTAVARVAVAGSKMYISKVKAATGFISLIFAVHPERRKLFERAVNRLITSGVQF